MEPIQFFYALICGMILFSVQFFLLKNPRERVLFVKYFLLLFGIITFLISIYLIFLFYKSALVEYINFLRTLSSIATYSMYPIYFSSSFNEYILISFFIISVFLISFYNIISKWRKGLILEYFVPLSISLYAIFIFQKFLIRPFNAIQVLGISLFGLLFFIAQLRFDKKYFDRFFLKKSLAVLFGIFATYIIMLSIPSLLDNYTKRLTTLYSDFAVLFDKNIHWNEIQKNYFQPKRFVIDGVSGADLKMIIANKLQFKKDDDLFILGDDSYLYIILNQKTPFYITFYNQSILYSQKNTVNWIHNHQPKYVMWRESFKEFDEVPNIVRAPLLFDDIVSNYAYLDRIGQFLILQRKNTATSINMDFWREHLGDTVNLGFIPSRSEPEKFTVHKNATSYNFNFLNVTIQNPVQDAIREIPFDIDGGVYKIAFKEKKNTYEYNINLNRIWFWQAARNIHKEAKLITNSNTDIFLKIIDIRTSRDILY